MKNKTIDYIIEFVDSQGTVVQEEGFEQVPVHHLTKKIMLCVAMWSCT